MVSFFALDKPSPLLYTKRMKKRLLTLSAIALLSGCTPNNAPPQQTVPVAHQTITATQAQAYMADGDAFVLLDVRTAEEFAAQHIPGAILIPYDEITNRAPAELPDKDVRIFIYCRRGRRSEIAAYELTAMGYLKVYDFGGVEIWSEDELALFFAHE